MHSLTHVGSGRCALPLLLGALAACSDDAATRATPTDPVPAFGRVGTGNNDRILFTSDRDGTYEIYSMNTDGTGIARLTNAPGYNGTAAVSPDGKKVVFQSTRDDLQGEIYVMNVDGTGVARLTYSVGYDVTPAWSRDGKQIAFASTRGRSTPG